jgi:DNA topoisomerase I
LRKLILRNFFIYIFNIFALTQKKEKKLNFNFKNKLSTFATKSIKIQMSKNLVIVESPAKAKTIEKFLGKDFIVESSFGHIADLPSKEIGVDIANGFKPKYEVSADKKALVKKLKDLSKKAETVWLASDEDREGEAIAWHLQEELELDKSKTKRIVFHEITKTAILKAIDNPRGINYDLVHAQQARRVLDRLVGYEVSPVLWKKVKSGLSAGRVQSVSVRLIVEREREIENFNSKAVYHIHAEFLNESGKGFKTKLEKNFESEKEAQLFLEKNIGASFEVMDLETKPTKKSPSAPFTTSTLQQEAARKLYLPVGITMQIAQRLYESGLITYMRTDSVNLSKDAQEAAAQTIIKNYGKEYSNPRNFATKSKGAQEAHEAIRPTDMNVSSVNIERDQARLYDLIWKRTMASQMSDAQLEKTNVVVKADKHQDRFLATGEVVKFDGFLKLYIEGTDNEEEEQEGMLPSLKLKEKLTNNYITATQKYSRPLSRYTEASLVKKLEELGIGRPSTYAPTISTVINRKYVEKGSFEGKERPYNQLILKNAKIETKTLKENFGSDKGKLVPTDIGNIVNDFLVKNFANILDYHFTAKVEEDFDAIAEGNKEWTEMMQNFYKDFHPNVLNVEQNATREQGERLLGTDPKTGKPLYVRLGKFGPLAQIGNSDDEDKKFANISNELNIGTITFEQALQLFDLPKKLGIINGEEVEANNGRFGPYIKYGSEFISLPKGMNPIDATLEDAKNLIETKNKADAPIGMYEGIPVQKGVGRFGPFIKWNGIFINVSKKYNFDNLSQDDLNQLIEEKQQKDIDKVIAYWPEEGIKIEKARWGKSVMTKGKLKIEFNKEIDASKITLEQAKAKFDEKFPKKTKTTATKSTTTNKVVKKK